MREMMVVVVVVTTTTTTKATGGHEAQIHEQNSQNRHKTDRTATEHLQIRILGLSISTVTNGTEYV